MILVAEELGEELLRAVEHAPLHVFEVVAFERLGVPQDICWIEVLRAHGARLRHGSLRDRALASDRRLVLLLADDVHEALRLRPLPLLFEGATAP